MWKEKDNKITKTFGFEGFSEAANFITQIAQEANQMNHHPDVFLHGYNKLKISLTTHDEGKVTEKDHQLAEKIDKLYNK